MIAIGGHWRSVAQSGAERRSPAQGLSLDVRFLEVALNLLRRRYSNPTDDREHASPWQASRPHQGSVDAGESRSLQCLPERSGVWDQG